MDIDKIFKLLGDKAEMEKLWKLAEDMVNGGHPFLKTWDEVENWNDVAFIANKTSNFDIIKSWDKIPNRCPYLDYKDECFIYCRARSHTLQAQGTFRSMSKPSLNSAEYNSQVGELEIGLWCSQPEEQRSKCLFYKDNKEKEINP